MRNYFTKSENFKTIEFWVVTALFVFSVFFLITDTLNNQLIPQRDTVNRQNVPGSYLFVAQLVKYIILYGAFLLLNFVVVPKLIKREAIFQSIILLILTYFIVATSFGIANTYILPHLFKIYKSRQVTYNVIFQKSFLYAVWLLMAFGFYTIIKYVGIYLLSRSEDLQKKYRFVTNGGIIATIIWLILFLIFIIEEPERVFIAIWAAIVPSGIAFYWYALHKLLPSAIKKRKPFRAYLFNSFILLLLSIIPVAVIGFILTNNIEAGFAISTFNAAFHFFITAPFSWIIFKRLMKGNEEVYVLKKELGQSHASFDFLRSQINPHFLFNALNTIYGTAIQEKAERTSEGIEKLGDMMRFMLQENMQEKISLSREIDYLNNYISLQKLRTDPNPNIKIEANIDAHFIPVQVAPMLLIPFVENAFKHGISFREPSHIKVTLEITDKILNFDVFNNKHLKPDNDPEKEKSGIGLNNVKQRLKLLYPNKHELIIRETGKDFFVHLTINLS